MAALAGGRFLPVVFVVRVKAVVRDYVVCRDDDLGGGHWGKAVSTI